MAIINIVGDLVLDQSAGLQDDDVAISVDAITGDISGGLDAAFLTYLNGLTLSAAQLAFADTAEAASQVGLVTVSPAAGENVVELEFAPLTNMSSGQFTVDGDEIFLTTAQNGSAVEAWAGGNLVAAFYIIPNAGNTSATVQMITFEAIDHPLNPQPDDRVNFSDILKVRALVETSTPIGDDINVDDDGPDVTLSGTAAPTLTADDTTLGTNPTGNFSVVFSTDFGTDGPGAAGVTYALDVLAPGTASGIFDVATGQEALLTRVGSVIEGRTAGNDLVFTVAVNATGIVTLDQLRAVQHTPDTGSDQSTTLAAANLITLTATAIDADGDTDAQAINIGQNLVFKDDAPSISAGGTEAVATVDESDTATNGTANFSSNFSGLYGADGAGTTTYALSVIAGASGLFDTLTGQAVNLSVTPGGVVEGRTAVGGALVFTVTVDAAGVVTLNQDRAVIHDPNNGPNDTETLSADNLIQLTATITDKDGDVDTAVLNIGQNLVLTDDAPTIVDQDTNVPGVQGFDGNPGTTGAQGETIAATGGTATGSFSFNIGADGHLAAFYAGGGSDFVDLDAGAGVQRLSLTGTVDNAQTPAITNVQTALVSETATSAQFSFSFHYDKDPITAGVQDATAGGTLTFDKAAGTYSLALTDAIDGFSFNVFHSSELLTKAPPGNTGHPELVVTELDANNGTTDTDGFYVQFTANTNPSGSPFGFNPTGDGNPLAGDTTFNNGQFVTSAFEDWVSATQSTNGVAGDTIQKGELLTLRFFNENILGDVNPGAPGGGTEKIAPTDAVDAIAIKFDGIGNSEDLIVVLDLINYGADGVLGGTGANLDVETTKSIFVQNADFFKGNTVPAPYNTEFSLDQNDGLVIIESNDYNATGEHYQIQGMQIMQSGNGLSGSAINLNRVTDDPSTLGVEGSSTGAASGTGGGAAQDWEGTDNDVLKITDIGFIQTTAGQIGADLDFAVNIQDGDGDTTGIQHLLVDVIA